MTRYVALLRGIYPSNPRMRNENLRQVARDLGYEEVSTVISSGNIVFASESTDPAGIEASFEAAWPERLGFESTTIVRSRAELAALVDLRPFGELVHKPETYLLATFSKEELSVPLELPQRPDGFEHDVVIASRAVEDDAMRLRVERQGNRLHDAQRIGIDDADRCVVFIGHQYPI